MTRKRRQSKIPTPAWEKDHGTLGNRVLGQSAQFYATVGVVALVIAALGVIAFAVISDEIDERNRPGTTVVQVDDRDYSLEDFTNRVQAYVEQNGGAEQLTLQAATSIIPLVQDQIVEEQILVRFAGEQGLSATEDEILNEIATRMGINKDDAAFATRFQEELDRTGLSESEYREGATAAVLRNKVLEKFQGEVPATSEAVNYSVIVVETQAEADAIRGELEAGGDFAAIALAKSLDTTTKEAGGVAGWTPRGILEKSMEDHLFAQDLNAITTYPTPSSVYVFKVTEKAADHTLDEEQKTTLSQAKYGEWFEEKKGSLTIEEFDTQDADNVEYLAKQVWPNEVQG